MKKNLSGYLILYLCCLGVSACQESVDDTALWNRLEGLEQRTMALEDRCRRINTNIAALQGLAKVSASSDRITSVVPLTVDGVVTGYTFSFCFSSPVTVYCATDGRDGVDGTDGRNGTDGNTSRFQRRTVGSIWSSIPPELKAGTVLKRILLYFTRKAIPTN